MDAVNKPEVLISLTAIGAVTLYLNGKISTVSGEMDEMKMHLQGILNTATVSQSEVESMRRLVTQLTQQTNRMNNDIAMLSQSVDRLTRTLGQLGLMDQTGTTHNIHQMNTQPANNIIPQHSINRPSYQVNVATQPQQPQHTADNSDVLSELGI